MSKADEARATRASATQETLIEMAIKLNGQRSLSFDAKKTLLMGQISHDPALLLALFWAWERAAVDALFSTAATVQRARMAQPEMGARTTARTKHPAPLRSGFRKVAGPTDAERAEARASVFKLVVRSVLDRMLIDGVPLGDCTPAKALTWADGKAAQVRFVRMVTSGLPPELPIRRFIRPEEADAMWQRAAAGGGRDV